MAELQSTSTTSEGQFELKGIQAYAKTWTPSGPTKAKLIFVHGFSEHINRYNDFFPLLADKGIQVFSWDQRGWGRTSPDKANWGMTGSTTEVIADVVTFVRDKLSSKDVPIFVMGHSMGGGEVATLMGDPQYDDVIAQVRGWILEAPFIAFTEGEEPNSLKIAVGRFVGRLLPNVKMQHIIPPESLSRVPEWAESIRNDPMCHNTGTLEGLASLLDRTAVLSSGTVKVSKSVRSLLLAHGTDDKTCSYNGAKKWLEGQTGVEDKTFKTYEGGYHQLHADLCKDELAADLTDWILKRTEGDGVTAEAKL